MTNWTKHNIPESLIEASKRALGEVEDDDKGTSKEYQAFFKKMLKKFGVDDPSELSKDEKKKFFDAVDKGFNSDDESGEDGVKKEETSLTEEEIKKLDDIFESLNEAKDDSDLNSVVDIVKKHGGTNLFGKQVDDLKQKFGKNNVSTMTSPMAAILINVKKRKIAIVNKKLADKPDAVVGEFAIGFMD